MTRGVEVATEQVGDVLCVRLVGAFTGQDMRQLVEVAASFDVGAMLLDVSLGAASPMADPMALAPFWLEQLPRRPCAAVCDVFVVDYVTRVGLLLASSRAQPTPLVVFGSSEREAAMRWACDYAMAFRQEQARRAQT